jgi:hypothetical protein
VPLPRRLTADLCDSPVAVGVFALIARRFLISGEPIPLSPADLQAYDPALRYGAARRALERLTAAGYCLVTRRAGRKACYTPCWGLVNGAPRPWDKAAPSLGRPRHIATLRLDDRLLDLCIGRLLPHAVHPAQVTRYVAEPLLSLRDVGCYTLALAGTQATPTPALSALGLCDAAGTAHPLPADATVLAVASQRNAGGLSAAGWSLAGFAPPRPDTPSTATGAALFFCPPDMIGGLIGGVIGGVIGSATPTHPAPSAAASAETTALETAAGSYRSTQRTQESTTLARPCGGGVMSSHERPLQQEDKGVTRQESKGIEGPGDQETADLPNEVLRALSALGVRGDVARTLADRPPAQVARVIAQAQARPDVRDRAAWVVSALRALPPDDAPPALLPPVSLTPILNHPTLTPQERMLWVRRFRSADPADRPAVLARFHAAHPQEPTHDACA